MVCVNTNKAGSSTTALIPQYRATAIRLPSPDGKYILFNRVERFPKYDDEGKCSFDGTGAIFKMHEDGSGLEHVVNSNYATRQSWQPIPGALIVEVSDGHTDPLDGLKVELRRLDEAADPNQIVSGDPRRVDGGIYAFDDIAAGRLHRARHAAGRRVEVLRHPARLV